MRAPESWWPVEPQRLRPVDAPSVTPLRGREDPNICRLDRRSQVGLLALQSDQPIATEGIELAHRQPKSRRNLSQYRIARLMAVHIIHVLEMVGIDHCHAHRAATLRTRQFRA
jgi:hypothetical protein